MGTGVKSKIHHYKGEAIEVQYDVARCIHAEACVRGLSAVFDKKKRPWIQPDAAPADAVAQTVEQCPSGALHYTRRDGGADETQPEHNTIQLVENGPLYVRGQVRISSEDGTVLLQDTRLALCRCGASNNKPLCDNSHLHIGFHAPSAGRTGIEAVSSDGGTLTIQPTHNGSLHLVGSFTILDDSGQTLFQGEEAWLCRCGGSGDKPFCDGTHKRNGFTAD